MRNSYDKLSDLVIYKNNHCVNKSVLAVNNYLITAILGQQQVALLGLSLVQPAFHPCLPNYWSLVGQ